MTEQLPLIRLTEVTRTYDLGEVTVNALRATSLDIQQGEYVALIGPSGSGKSTLMNTLGCLDRPTSGSYLLDGEEIVEMSLDERARIRNRQNRLRLPEFQLAQPHDALENVEVPLLYAPSMSTSQRHERAAEELTRVGLGDRMDHTTSQLSGGQQQRVAIARALINRPSILLADEPTGNLDSRTSREVIALFKELNEVQGLTVILVTHDPEVARNAKRNIVLRDGHVIEDTSDFSQRCNRYRLTARPSRKVKLDS